MRRWATRQPKPQLTITIWWWRREMSARATGATVGKLFGIKCAMKGGVGCWTEEVVTSSDTGGPVRISALAAVNAFGDVHDPESGRILAGARVAPDSREFADRAAAMRRGKVRKSFSDPNTVLV